MRHRTILATVAGAIAAVGSRLIQSAAARLMDHFFSTLADEFARK